MAHTEEAERLAFQLRLLKGRAGLSFEALASRTGIGKSSLHRYCAGAKIPVDPGVIFAFAKACGASREEFQELHGLWSVADIARSQSTFPAQRNSERRQPAETAPAQPNRPESKARRRFRRPAVAVPLVLFSVVAVLASLVALDANEEATVPAGTRPLDAADTTLHTDAGNSYPRHLIAAGQIALSAYYKTRAKTINDRGEEGDLITRTWYLYDRDSDSYQKVPWVFLDVAPGMQQAAVLRGPLPAPQVGLLDMKTLRVTRWIGLDHLAGGVSWSPDGRRLLVTTYNTNPDENYPFKSSRTGFLIINLGSGRMSFHALAASERGINARQDLGWSMDGRLLRSPDINPKLFYDLNGTPQPAPPNEGEYGSELSPNRRYIALEGGFHASAAVEDVATGQKVSVTQVEGFETWADDSNIIARKCDEKHCKGRGEFHNRLVLINIYNKTITPLTGYQISDNPDGWAPLFTHR